MSSLNPMDLLDLDNVFTEEEQMVRDSVARFVDERVLPDIGEWFDDHHFPAHLVPEIAELGLLGSSIDGYECAGLNSVSYGLICQQLERGDSGLRSFVSVQSSLCMYPIHAFGSDEQKDRWLPAMARGEVIGCFGLTEPHGGSDPSNMKTRAKREGGDWVITGNKMWITNGTIADIAIVWAQTDEGIRAFVVEKDMAGFSAPEIKRKMSLRASVTSELVLDQVRVPDSNRLPGAEGLKAALSCLSQARFGIAWGAIGAAQACLQEVIDYTAERKLFDRSLNKNQLVQLRLADMARRIENARLLALHLGRQKDAGKLQHVQISLAKWNNVRMALDVARDARDLLGGAGITVEHSPVRHMLNLESVITYEGTESIHQLVVGRALTGESAF